MKITAIRASAGAKWPNPVEDYSNLSASIDLTARIDEGDDPETVAAHLHELAHSIVDQRKREVNDQLTDPTEEELADEILGPGSEHLRGDQ